MEQINGQLLKQMLESGMNNLGNHSAEVDSLNVFPVPDGDTGTNMYLTVSNGVKAALEAPGEHVGKIFKALSRGLLMGARGNSGVITSQIFRGIYQAVEDNESIDAMQLAHALVNGNTEAPVESLRWAADTDSWAGQVRELGRLARAGAQSWKKYQQRCETAAMTMAPEDAERLRDTLGCMAEIHQGGSEALADFCEAALHCRKGNLLQAYLWTDAALQRTGRTAEAMDRACHGRFAHYYDNDCFVGVRLTERELEDVRE